MSVRTLKAKSSKNAATPKKIFSPLPSVFKIINSTIKQIKTNKKLFAKVTLIYAVLLLIFVWSGGGLINANQTKQTVNQALGTNGNNIMANLTVFSMLVGSSSSSSNNELKSLYQTIIVILLGLVFIWVFRHTKIDKVQQIKARDPFYKGMTPLVPFLLVLLVVGIQLLPLLFGSALLGIVFGNGLAVNPLEQTLWITLFILTFSLSAYWLASSLFALIIVTLPEMTPLKALRTAKKMVKGRRFAIIKKLLGATFLALVLVGSVVLATIYVAPVIAQTLLIVFGIMLLPVATGYIYVLYQEML